MDKFQNAIAEYEQQRQRINHLTGAISEATSWFDEETQQGGPSCSNIDERGETCISRQWAENRKTIEAYECMEETVTPEKIDLCDSCALVQKLVTERKEAKKLFGIAKRRISQLGKPLLSASC